MPNVRLHEDVKNRLDYLAGQDLSINDVIKMLLERTIPCEYDDEDDDEDQSDFEDW